MNLTINIYPKISAIEIFLNLIILYVYFVHNNSYVPSSSLVKVSDFTEQDSFALSI